MCILLLVLVMMEKTKCVEASVSNVAGGRFKSESDRGPNMLRVHNVWQARQWRATEKEHQRLACTVYS